MEQTLRVTCGFPPDVANGLAKALDEAGFDEESLAAATDRDLEKLPAVKPGYLPKFRKLRPESGATTSGQERAVKKQRFMAGRKVEAGPVVSADRDIIIPFEQLPHVRDLHDRVLGRQLALLHGPRRSGKSSSVVFLCQQLVELGSFVVLLLEISVGISFRDGVPRFWQTLSTRLFPNQPALDSSDAFRARILASPLPVVLVLDEFDALLTASDDVRSSFLATLRVLASQEFEGKFQAFIGVGTFNVSNLAASPTDSISPFNAASLVELSRPTLGQVDAFLREVEKEYAVQIEELVKMDVYSLCGDHVGLLSQTAVFAIAQASGGPLTLPKWAQYASRSLPAAVVTSMMFRRVFDELPSRQLLPTLLRLADGSAIGRDGVMLAGIAPLIDAGVLRVHAGGWAFSCSLFRSVLLELLYTPPAPSVVATLPVKAGSMLDLRATLLMALSLVNADLVASALTQNVDSPAESAWHAELYYALRLLCDSSTRARGLVATCHVEVRRAEAGAGAGECDKKRLDILLVDGGRSGIELKVEKRQASEMQQALEQADQYAVRLATSEMLLVNFLPITTLPGALLFPSSPCTSVVHVLYDLAARSLRVYFASDDVTTVVLRP